MSTFVSGVDFVCIPTQDYDRAAAFYGETLGLPFRKRWGDMPAGEFQAGDTTIALMQLDAFGQEFRRNGGPLALHVDDVEARRTELEGKGVQFVMDTIDSGVCHQAIFTDPDGNPLILHNRYAPGG
jgi:catechol 2,3-dioxygenase-like lactoylglutathione lyase family enzyme